MSGDRLEVSGVGDAQAISFWQTASRPGMACAFARSMISGSIDGDMILR
jgi:hypothetical protein